MVEERGRQKDDPNLEVAKINERTAKTNKVAALFTLLGGLLGAAVVLGTQVGPALAGYLDRKATAKEVLVVESLKKNETIARDTLDVHLNGTLKEDLPSGKVIWSALRKSSGEGDSGSADHPNFAVMQLCTVNEAGRTFDCGSHQVGPDVPEPGTYFLYVGLADSSASRQLLDMALDQKVNEDWSHPKPGGYDPLDPIIINRR